jgi:CelD/BcsL family acetyltransferase involved in cellulose biosynthesis
MNCIFLDSKENFNRVRDVWTSLIANGSPHSFFQSWAWIENWLESLHDENQSVTLVMVIEEEIPVLAFFLGKNKFKRRYLFSGHSISLNTTNNAYYDSLCVDFNSFLIKPVYSGDLQEIISETAKDYSWDEFVFSNTTEDFYQKINDSFQQKKNYNVLVSYKNPSYYVNLDKVRSSDGDYFSLLSKNRKKQLKSTINAYKKLGDLQIVPADSVEEALLFLNELVMLHQKKWVERGEVGAFSNKYLFGFHKNLIKRCFSAGTIQLLKVNCGGKAVGYLYNFIYNNKVYFYQSGLAYRKENKYRPGLVTHYLAIMLNSDLGHREYDFLTGDRAYKKSMATDESNTYYMTIQKNSYKFLVENTLVYLKGRMQADIHLPDKRYNQCPTEKA